jgi:hypothetical protein
MLGYHDSPKCAFDIWSPNPTRWGNNAIENRAFSPYCLHMTTLDGIVNKIFEAAQNGVMYFDCTCFETLTTSDIEYIECRLNKLGLTVSLTLD